MPDGLLDKAYVTLCRMFAWRDPFSFEINYVKLMTVQINNYTEIKECNH